MRREHVEFVRALLDRYHLGADRDDLAQDVLLRASRLADDGNPAGLLVQTARFVLLEHWRRQRRQDALADIEAIMEPVPSPEALHATAARREIVRAVIAELPEPGRTVFGRVEIDGESVNDVAASLGRCRETVSAQLRTARARFLSALLRHMSRRGVKPGDI